jgi:hypothetical protein
MKTVIITKGFTLLKDDRTKIPFTPGVYELDDEVAEHWYVLAHSNNPHPRPQERIQPQEDEADDEPQDNQKKVVRRRVVEEK